MPTAARISSSQKDKEKTNAKQTLQCRLWYSLFCLIRALHCMMQAVLIVNLKQISENSITHLNSISHSTLSTSTYKEAMNIIANSPGLLCLAAFQISSLIWLNFFPCGDDDGGKSTPPKQTSQSFAQIQSGTAGPGR